MSPKASPWRNGFQESFYAGFKADLKDIRRFNQLGELIEAIELDNKYKLLQEDQYDEVYEEINPLLTQALKK
jgi:hypothetical protein